VCKWLLECNVTNIHILLGAAYIYDVERFDEFGDSVRVHYNLKSEQIVTVMRKCNMAIASSSGVAYECVAAGLPMITGHYLQHQQKFYEALQKQQNITGVGSWLDCTKNVLQGAIEVLKEEYNPNYNGFIDGKQPLRYLGIFRTLAAAS